VIWIGHPEFHILISILAVVIFFGILGLELGKGTYAKIKGRDQDGGPKTR
jgi:hypothetical protein